MGYYNNGTVTVMSKADALERLKAELDGVSMEGYDCHPTEFASSDVLDIVVYNWSSDEGYGSYDLVAVVRLTEDRWGVYGAWASTSGHGCRCDVHTHVENSLPQALFHLTEQELIWIFDNGARTEVE